MNAPRRAVSGPTCRPHKLGGVVVEIPLASPLVSEANARGHTIAKAGRVAQMRSMVAEVLRVMASDVRLPDGEQLVVCMTRVASRPLDDDNLAGACKSARDGVADFLGVNDRDARVVWRVAQERGAAALRIEVLPVRAWSTAAASSRVVQAGAVTEVDATLAGEMLRALRDKIDAMLAGERSEVAFRVGAVRLRLHAQRSGR